MKSFPYQLQKAITLNDSTANEMFNLKGYLCTPGEMLLPVYAEPRASWKEPLSGSVKWNLQLTDGSKRNSPSLWLRWSQCVWNSQQSPFVPCKCEQHLFIYDQGAKKSHNPPWALDSFVFNSMSPLLMYLNIHTQYNPSKVLTVSLTVRSKGSAHII